MKQDRLLPTVLIVLFLAGCEARIQHGLSEAEANEIQTVLLERGFDARKVSEGGKKPTWAIEVDEEHAQSATRILAELGLPRPKLPGFEAMQVGLVATPSQERAAQLNALSEELASTLQAVAGVTMARVHLVAPMPPRPGQMPGQAKASAFLRVRPGHGKQVKAMEAELRKLVAGSVEGLSSEDVTLVVDEVVSNVPDITPTSGLDKTRWLIGALGGLVSVLALLMVFLALRLRSTQAKAAELARAAMAQAATPQTRPVINAAARKAA